MLLKVVAQFCVPVSNPLDNDFCRNILESAKRVSGKPVSKKTSISVDIIKLIIDNFAGPQCSLKHLRLLPFVL